MSPKSFVLAELLDACVTIPHHVVHRPFPAETVVLNLETGQYHGLSAVRGRMLQELERHGTPRAAAAALAMECEHPIEDVERDVCALCAELAERGLILIGAS
jgi:hypothetical protein